MRDLTELFQEFNDLSPRFELHERVVTDASLILGVATPTPQRALPQTGHRSVTWLLAGAGVAFVVLLLAIAAHSRREPSPAATKPLAAGATKSITTPTGVSLHYPARWFARLQRSTVYPGSSILITSYRTPRGSTYSHARDTRPAHGTLILVADIHPAAAYLHDSMYPSRPAHLTLGTYGSFEGLGNGYRVTFTDQGHAIAALVAADRSAQPTVTRILNSITVTPAPAESWQARIQTWQHRLAAASRNGIDYRYPTPSEHTFRQRLAEASARYRFRVLLVKWVRAPQGAPAIILQPKTSAATFAHDLPAIQRLVAPTHRSTNDKTATAYEGIFIGAQTATGAPFLYVFQTMRTGTGGQWASHANLLPFPHG